MVEFGTDPVSLKITVTKPFFHYPIFRCMFSAIAANKMFEPELTRKLEPRLGFCSGRCACLGNDQAIGEFFTNNRF